MAATSSRATPTPHPDLLPAEGAPAGPPATSARRPRWWGELLVIVWLCWIYDAINNLAPLRRVAPYHHARDLLHLEQYLHLDPEATLDHWLSTHLTASWWASNYYDDLHFVVTLGIVGWLWWRHPGPYRPLRSALVLTNVIGFAVYWLYPTAPPRLLDPHRYVDVVAASHTFGSWHSGTLATAANELAAMPSLHVSWALWSALAIWVVHRRGRPWVAVVWLYPLATAVDVMATGNHFLADVVAGALVLVVALLVGERAQAWWDTWWPARRTRRRTGGGEPVLREAQEAGGIASSSSQYGPDVTISSRDLGHTIHRE